MSNASSNGIEGEVHQGTVQQKSGTSEEQELMYSFLLSQQNAKDGQAQGGKAAVPGNPSSSPASTPESQEEVVFNPSVFTVSPHGQVVSSGGGYFPKEGAYYAEVGRDHPQQMEITGMMESGGGSDKDVMEGMRVRTNKRSRSAEDRENARAEQQRLASRRYRQKKKHIVEDLEGKMKEIHDEKKKLEEEHHSTLQLVNQLQVENEHLRKVSHIEKQKQVAQLEKHRLVFLEQLEDLVQRDAPETSLSPVLERVKEVYHRVTGLGEVHLGLFATSTVVNQIIKSGFFGEPSAVSLTLPGEEPCSVAAFVHRVSSCIALSDQQKEAINAILKTYQEEHQRVIDERLNLNKEITTLFAQTGAINPQNHDMPKFLQIMSFLEYLRKNLNDESSKMTSALDQIINLLSLKQQSKLFLELELQNKSVVQLKTMWDAMCNSVGFSKEEGRKE